MAIKTRSGGPSSAPTRASGGAVPARINVVLLGLGVVGAGVARALSERAETYSNRIGITITEHAYSAGNSEVQRYLNKSRLLDEKPDLLRLDVMGEDADEQRLIEGIKKLIS